jgi:hypothetical protein
VGYGQFVIPDKKTQSVIEERNKKEIEEEEKKKKEEERRLELEWIIEKKKQEEEKQKKKTEALINEMKKNGLKNLIQEVTSFGNFKGIVEKYKKIDNSNLESQLEYIKQFVISNVESEPKKWKKVNRDNWKKLSSLIGRETTEKWYDEIINKK